MDVGAIAAASTDFKLSQVQEQYSVSLLKKALNQSENAAEELIETADAAPVVPKGEFIDVFV